VVDKHNASGLGRVYIAAGRRQPRRRASLITFEQFVTTRLRQLVGLAVSLCSGDRPQAEDLVQEVLLKAHRRWDRMAPDRDPYSYVRRMVVNEYLSWRRRWGRMLPSQNLPDVIPDAPDPATTYADRTVLDAALATLAKRQRAVLVLRYYDGLTDREIAEVLGCSVGTVRGYASRALAAMRTHMNTLVPDDCET
jgi:RNA polymerase sigma-70 factor (sigma-E family)